MTPTGVLNVDLEQKTHMLSLTLMGSVEVELDCVHSTSGAYRKKGCHALRRNRRPGYAISASVAIH